MPDLLPHQVLQETLLVDQIPALTHVLMQQEVRDLLREPVGRMQPELLITRDNPENRGDWLA
jgi:hypothetical protein